MIAFEVPQPFVLLILVIISTLFIAPFPLGIPSAEKKEKLREIAAALTHNERIWVAKKLHQEGYGPKPQESQSMVSGDSSPAKSEGLTTPLSPPPLIFELGEGKLSERGGRVNLKGKFIRGCFVIDLLREKHDDDIALHLSIRGKDRQVVRNHYAKGMWAAEDHSKHFPFKMHREFNIEIAGGAGGMDIKVNDEHLFSQKRALAGGSGSIKVIKIHKECPGDDKSNPKTVLFRTPTTQSSKIANTSQTVEEGRLPLSDATSKDQTKEDIPLDNITPASANRHMKGLPRIAICGQLWLDEDVSRPRQAECNCPVRGGDKDGCTGETDVRVYGMGISEDVEKDVLSVGYDMEWNVAFWHEKTNGTGKFNMTATYHRKASIQIPYLCTWDLVRRFGKGSPAVFDTKQKLSEKGASAVAMISNCGAKDRKEYMTKMATIMDVSNSGSCNIPGVKSMAAPGRWGGNWYKRKSQILKKFPFYLAFENSNLTDYVTEKVYSAYFSGVVPVFWGSPTVESLVPTGSYIDANKFAGPLELAKELKAIANDHSRYMSYFEYLPDGLSKLFDSTCKESLMCRICKEARSKLKR
ncbi:hypothetical protein AAMO2058_000188800 [Amorphochlora amoebiformis]